jgi:SPP1 gp7 family putative phage head morphogenesis protein
MPDAPDLSFALGLPPERAISYFKAKGYEVAFDWHEMLADAHARAFTVAKATRLDILADIRGAVQKALDTGTTLRQFQKDLTPLLQSKGWWGKKEIVDPRTGEVRRAQLGSPWRLKTIYETNLATAYAAGRYREQIENAEAQPYWMYVAVMDSRTRPGHAALNGKTLRHDDPFWSSFYPPNGWNCRCRVRALTPERVRRKGTKVETSDGLVSHEDVAVARDGRTARMAIYSNPKTGLRVQTDPGWAHNPGKSWPLTDRNGRLPDCTASFAEGAEKCVKMLMGQKDWKAYGRPDLRTVPEGQRQPAPGLLPAGKTRPEAEAILARALGLDKRPLIEVATPIERVYLKRELLAHLVEKPENARERYANFILPTLQRPFEIYRTEYEDGFRDRYVGLFTGKYNLLTVARINKDGSVLWNVMNVEDKRMNKQRVGELLYPKK